LDAKHHLDFGKGFYTTTNLEQANKRAWDLQEQYRDPRTGQLNKLHRGIVIAFDLHQEILYSIPEQQYRVFHAPDELWAEFIVANRVDRGGIVHRHPYQWTYGPMADGITVRLCQSYSVNKISIVELMYGYQDSYTKQHIRGIKPFQDDSDQLVFHDDATVNSFITQARIAQYAKDPITISKTRR
jgi:Protein of unknown function (DUF3990)